MIPPSLRYHSSDVQFYCSFGTIGDVDAAWLLIFSQFQENASLMNPPAPGSVNLTLFNACSQNSSYENPVLQHSTPSRNHGLVENFIEFPLKKCDQNWGMFNTRGTGSVDRAFPGPPQAFSMLDERWRTLLLREKVWRHCDDFAVPSVVQEKWGIEHHKKDEFPR